MDGSFREKHLRYAGAFFVAIRQQNRRIMAQVWAESFYKSKKWQRCRNAYIQHRIQMDGGLCEECKDRLGYIVHHKITLTQDNINDPEVALNHDELEYVCKDCHDLFEGHGLNQGSKPLCMFDTEGQPISLREIDRKMLNTDMQSPP